MSQTFDNYFMNFAILEQSVDEWIDNKNFAVIAVVVVLLIVAISACVAVFIVWKRQSKTYYLCKTVFHISNTSRMHIKHMLRLLVFDTPDRPQNHMSCRCTIDPLAAAAKRPWFNSQMHLFLGPLPTARLGHRQRVRSWARCCRFNSRWIL